MKSLLRFGGQQGWVRMGVRAKADPPSARLILSLYSNPIVALNRNLIAPSWRLYGIFFDGLAARLGGGFAGEGRANGILGVSDRGRGPKHRKREP